MHCCCCSRLPTTTRQFIFFIAINYSLLLLSLLTANPNPSMQMRLNWGPRRHIQFFFSSLALVEVKLNLSVQNMQNHRIGGEAAKKGSFSTLNFIEGNCKGRLHWAMQKNGNEVVNVEEKDIWDTSFGQDTFSMHNFFFKRRAKFHQLIFLYCENLKFFSIFGGGGHTHYAEREQQKRWFKTTLIVGVTSILSTHEWMVCIF